MCHGCCRCCAVPMLFSWRKPDHISGADLLDWTAPALHTAVTRSDDQGLTERMRMPSSSSTRLEGDHGADGTRRLRRVEQRVNSNRAGKPLCRALARRLGTVSLDLHSCLLSEAKAPPV